MNHERVLTRMETEVWRCDPGPGVLANGGILKKSVLG